MSAGWWLPSRPSPVSGRMAAFPRRIPISMDVEDVMRAALVEAGYGPDAVGSALPRIMRILEAEDVRLELGRVLSRKEREYVRLQLGPGLSVAEIVQSLKR